jgi:hypothetical protein
MLQSSGWNWRDAYNAAQDELNRYHARLGALVGTEPHDCAADPVDIVTQRMAALTAENAKLTADLGIAEGLTEKQERRLLELAAENARLREALNYVIRDHIPHDQEHVHYNDGPCGICLSVAALNTPATDAEIDRIRREAAAEELERLVTKLTYLDDAAQAINTRLFIGSALFLIESRIEELRGKP